ncbi:putative EH domain, EF-hand domain, EF-hand domain pair, EF-Hand 1, calcium-binding protein [Helianthus annuus]|nr:putative EH domain, EF-hand domain, EF-hand domain pair, EF-Hand 1, calcium-binding protein [Helianthus annuus]KAJ0707700.1 putative EH domain, EF-hand domain, EF-hand domain pair, EF-Hand 1, calcium-binding protein [Helianthus annuus]KAJ0711682.1 putative EH domain, EF-hand domain, EF-hand domain pair, EF-Hand 1, calcium-binding protein [Helianthus annuus]
MAVNTDQFELYFKRADVDQDGRVSGSEAVSFFQASGLPKPVLAQDHIWTYADQNRSGYLGRAEFYNYLKLVTVAQSKRDLTPDIVKAALYGPASAKIPPPQINLPASTPPQSNPNMVGSAGNGIRGYSPQQSQVMRANPIVPGGGANIHNNSLTSGVHAQVSSTTSSLLQNAKPNGSAATVPAPKDSIARGVSGNGFASFGDAVSSQASFSLPVSAGGAQLPTKPFQSHQPTANQNHQTHPNFRHNQQAAGSTFPPVRPESLPSSQPWPKMSQTSVQKYTKVFMEVDTDRDGKITGEQARNLFLSWKLPREILKQVWDLSDEDNDSMLSLKEFCIALYLMERFREGRPLPKVLPPNIFEGQTPAASQWRPSPGIQQAHGMTGPRQVAPVAARPPRPVPVPIPEADEQPKQRKQTVPVLEKHLVDQLSTEEQKLLNSKFQEATEADKKVGELEKEILEARQKIEFYRNKMQEIVLYKSRCDSRLNEITERVASDKREVESLSKKYEEKYKQSGDVASKLTIEEATFRDIQGKKMELYRAIVKLDQDGKPDEIQARVDSIQADLEEQVKMLNERCKMYGLRGKPTSLLELPFGWQSGIQEGAADWDEKWDSFEDEGFTFVKELTLDVQNVVAPPKPKSHESKSTSRDGATTVPTASDADKLTPDSDMNEKDKDKDKEKTMEMEKKKEKESPPNSPAASSKEPESPPNKIFHEKTQSEHSDVPSVISGDKDFDEAGWPSFDTSYDSDAAWDSNATKPNKEESTQLFDGWGGLNPIRTEVPKKATFTFDSVPGTPSYNSSPPGDSLFQNHGLFSSTFDSSVPSTPAYSYAGSPRQQPFVSVFADSVPSTPMYATNSPREDHSFTNNFSRFDSFNSTPNDGGLFQSRDSFSRFDSFRSTAQDSEYDHNTLARFDSMRSTTVDSDFGHSLFQNPNDSFSRFDSTNESSDFSHGFPSFDDADPFGSSGPFMSHDPFKTTVESETPRRDSVDGWKAF